MTARRIGRHGLDDELTDLLAQLVEFLIGERLEVGGCFDGGQNHMDSLLSTIRSDVAAEPGSGTLTCMNSTLVEQDVLARALGEAMVGGGEFAEVFVEDRTTSSAMLDQRRVEQLSSGHERGAGIRVVVGDTTGFAHTADLSETGLIAAARAAAAVARDGGGGVREIALGPLRDNPSRAAILPGDVDKARKIELMNHADDAARSEGSSITQVQVALGDSTRHFVVANSDGLVAGDHQVRTRFNVSCIATGDTGMQTGYRPIAGTRGLELLGAEVVADAARGAA